MGFKNVAKEIGKSVAHSFVNTMDSNFKKLGKEGFEAEFLHDFIDGEVDSFGRPKRNDEEDDYDY